MLSTGPQSSPLSRSVPSLVPPVSQPPAPLLDLRKGNTGDPRHCRAVGFGGDSPPDVFEGWTHGLVIDSMVPVNAPPHGSNSGFKGHRKDSEDTVAPHDIFLECCYTGDMIVGPENGEYDQKSRPSSPVSAVIQRGLPPLNHCNGSPKVSSVGSPTSTAVSQAGTINQLPSSPSSTPEHSTHGLPSAPKNSTHGLPSTPEHLTHGLPRIKYILLKRIRAVKKQFLGGLRLMLKKTDKTD